MKKTFLSLILSSLLFSTGGVYANTSSVQDLQMKAQQGDLNAQTELATMYFYGEGIEENAEKAFELFKKPAEQGQYSAQYYLGILYRDGDGTQANAKKAIEWLEKSAQQDVYIAQYELALMYQKGQGNNKDLNKAFKWMLKAAKHEINEETVVPEYHLAKMYQQGQGTPKDLEQAFYWMSKAAQRHHLLSQYELAMMHETGQGTEKNLEKALALYQRPANNMIYDARRRIWDIQLQVAQQKTGQEANLYYEQAVKTNNGNAARIMAKKYAQGDVVTHNKEKAIELYHIFFRSPYSEIKPSQPEFVSEAMYWVDRLEVSPDDGEANYQAAEKSYNSFFKLYEPYIPYDPEKVEKLYKRAAELGHAGGQYEWAKTIRKTDPAEAFRLTLSAAEKGHVAAQMYIATSYTQGSEFLEKDLEKAKEWYLKTQRDHKDKVGDAILAKHALSAYERLGGKDKTTNDDLDANYNLANQQYIGIFNGYPASKYSEPADIKKSIESYLPLAEKGHSEAQAKVAGLYVLLEDYTTALDWYQKALSDYGNVKYKPEQKSPEEFVAKTKYEFAQAYENAPKELQQQAKALKLYNESAQAGWSRAQYHLAKIYDEGLLGQKIDHKRALYWYVQHAENKNPDIQVKDSAKRVVAAIKNKGSLIRPDGKTTTLINDPETILWLSYKVADLEAYLDIAQAHEKGNGTPINYKTALDYYQYAVNKDEKDPRAYFHLGRLFSKDLGIKNESYDPRHTSYRGKDDQIAFYYYKQAADLGHAVSQYAVGKRYELGEGVKKDLNKAIEWYRQAVKQGQRRAQYQLGLKYEHGEGVKKDLAQAIALYTQAAEQNLDSAQYTLAIKYDKGEGVEQNTQKAFDLYMQAAQQGHVESQYNLGTKYDTGHGVTRDVKQAAVWYGKAAEQNYADAQYNLALMYDKGQGVAKNQETALTWYAKAAQQGQAAAQNHFGILHDTKGGSLNDMIAVNWYRLAAEQGYADAQYNLAVMYEDGQGIEQSYRQAFNWYEKAAANQHVVAKYNLAWMYEQGQGVKQNYKKAAELYEAVINEGDAKAKDTATAALQRVKKHLTFGFLG